mmetsp:Transcript_20276/g.62683  ORF Transcript_20276/g.62683 Transcript_20276/m.62683 type:complete len:315 (-) Transcript_20276:106-1050(-)
MRGGDARRVYGFVQVRHLRQLVFEMRHFRGVQAVRFGDRSGGADERVADAGLADVGAPVVRREALDQICREVGFAVHEDALRRHDDVLEEDRRFLTSIIPVAHVDTILFIRACIAGLASQDVREARVVHRYGTRYCVIRIGAREALAGHDDEVVRVQRARLVHLAASQNEAAVGTALGHAHVLVGIVLLMRRLGSVSLRVGHRPAHDEVVRLDVSHEGLEALVVLRAVRGVDAVRHRVRRVHRVHADAALKARARQLSQPALHQVLRHHLFGRGGDVREAVHSFLRELGPHRRQLRLRLGQSVRLGHGVHRRSD